MDTSFLRSVLARQPQTLNTLQPNEFRVVFSKIPHVVYFCQKANIPGLQLNEYQQPTPFATPVRRPMGQILYDNFDMDFLVAEDMENWKQLHDWLTSIPPTVEWKDEKKKHQDYYSDASLLIMNSMSKPFFAIHFRNCFPLSLSNIELQTTVNDITPVMCSASFGYTGYYIEKLTSS
jgi:hypothetical protein